MFIKEKEKEFIELVRKNAMKAILYELSATPKPGLVDRNNSGAHNDMDFFTFMASSSALSNVFALCAKEGLQYSKSDFRGLLNALRPIGIKAEKEMFKATKGVNTHKGLIFSLGIISAAAASLYVESPFLSIDSIKISDRIKEIAKGISQNELESIKTEKALTNGEKIYLKYGIKGIRGQVEEGFPNVKELSLHLLKDMLKNKLIPLNDILVHVLIYLISITEDSNIISRHGIEALDYVKEKASYVLKAGGMLTKSGKKLIFEMDKDFISKNISPGGSADLLAVTIMFYLLEDALSI